MPKNNPEQMVNEAYSVRDRFRQAAYNIGMEAMRIEEMMAERLWPTGTRRMSPAGFADLRAARQQLAYAMGKVDEILAQLPAPAEEES